MDLKKNKQSINSAINTHFDARSSDHRSSNHAMDLRESILAQTDISLVLAKHVISSHAKDTNAVFSPLSVHVVLGLIAAGSAGPTRDQLLGFLKTKSAEELDTFSSQIVSLVFADGSPLGGPLLSFANGVWVDRSFSLKPAFKEVVENSYRAASAHVDFQNQVCNSSFLLVWIEEISVLLICIRVENSWFRTPLLVLD